MEDKYCISKPLEQGTNLKHCVFESRVENGCLLSDIDINTKTEASATVRYPKAG